MIIRSQNGEIVEEFTLVQYVGNYYESKPHHALRSKFYMAEYSSKEKAMKVLEDLHAELIHGSKYFDFPKDEDVKV